MSGRVIRRLLGGYRNTKEEAWYSVVHRKLAWQRVSELSSKRQKWG